MEEWNYLIRRVGVKSLRRQFPRTHLLVVEALPLGRAAEGLQVLGEGCAAVGDGQVGQQLLQGDRVGVLVQQCAHDGHQVGEGLRLAAATLIHDPLRPQVGAQLPQQEAHFLPAQAQDRLEEAVQLQVGHLEHLE